MVNDLQLCKTFPSNWVKTVFCYEQLYLSKESSSSMEDLCNMWQKQERDYPCTFCSPEFSTMCSSALTPNWIELRDNQIGSQVAQKLTVLIAKADFRTKTLSL